MAVLQNHDRLFDIKAKLPIFHSRLNPDDFLNWITTVKRSYEVIDDPDNKKVKIMALKLEGYAFNWQKNIQDSQVSIRKMKITDLPKTENIQATTLFLKNTLTFFINLIWILDGTKGATKYQ